MAKLKRKGRHSPAGERWLGGLSVKKRLREEKLARTTPVYFKHIRRKSDETRLREAGLSESDMRSLGYGRKKIKRKR